MVTAKAKTSAEEMTSGTRAKNFEKEKGPYVVPIQLIGPTGKRRSRNDGYVTDDRSYEKIRRKLPTESLLRPSSYPRCVIGPNNEPSCMEHSKSDIGESRAPEHRLFFSRSKKIVIFEDCTKKERYAMVECGGEKKAGY
jgi:hypothetical protein